MKKVPFSLKRSRRSFIFNYIIGTVLLLYIFFSGVFFIDKGITFLFITLTLIFFLEPEGVLSYRSYHIKEENITEERGFISKKRITIPHTSISNITMNKNIIGRILGFGDIAITSFSGEKESIILRGVKHPEKLFNLIENITSEKV